MLLTLALLATWGEAWAAPAVEDTQANEIMAKALDQEHTHSTFTAEVEMVLIDQGGLKRTRRMKVFSKRQGQLSQRIVFFEAPPDIRGTGFLSVTRKDPGSGQDQTEQWIYLPALGKIKRIATGDARQSFMGSDLNYGDMARRGLEGFTFHLLREDKVRGHPVWIIEALPVSEEMARQVGYSRALYLVRQDNFAVVRAVNWLLTGNRMRYLDVLRLEEVNGVWTPMEVDVWTSAGKEVLHKTTLRSSGVRVGQELPADIFSRQRLEKGL